MRALVISVFLCLGLAGSSVAAAEPASTEVVYTRPSKPSGFWGSGRPATGGAYRWRMLGIGVALLGVTGIVMIRLVRRANRFNRERKS